ncbi:unnamed protein product [Nezara viridula]|uniref:Uncharacterized protein n=1 Tax=Nezara viridula TaxID=85310 RepID=A0A9P0MV13_NEZVI|nr:unnamed protein product [Nezara viridula]
MLTIEVTFLGGRKGQEARRPPLLLGLPDGVEVREVVVGDGHDREVAAEGSGDAALAVEQPLHAPPSHSLPAHLVLRVHVVLVDQLHVALVGRDELHPAMAELRLTLSRTSAPRGAPGAGHCSHNVGTLFIFRDPHFGSSNPDRYEGNNK